MLVRARSILSTLWVQIRARRLWVLLVWLVAGTGVLSWWLIGQARMNPIVRVEGSTFAASIGCVPRAVTIVTRADYLKLRQARLIIQDGSGGQTPTRVLFQAAPLIAGDVHGFTLNLTAEEQSKASLKVAELGKSATIRLSIEFDRVAWLDVHSLRIEAANHPANPTCDNGPWAAEPLRSRVVTGPATVLSTIVPQEEIGDWLVKVNRIGGALSIGALLLTLAWLLWQGTRGFWHLYLLPPDRVKKDIADRYKKKVHLFSAANEIELIRGDFELIHRRLAFVRVLGPAVGFLLTVSSLVAGLHPSHPSGDNSFQFVSSLQLALVATFVGLLVRILAEFALRLHTAASERALLLVKGP